MIRLTTQVEDRELVAAIHALGRDRVKRFVRLMLLYKDDQLLLEECAEFARKIGIAKPGERIGITAGLPAGYSGGTNLFKVHTL